MNSWREEKSTGHIWNAPKKALAGIPQPIEEWLSKMVLLGEVPLAYLVADEWELPMESIRFFYVNANWLRAMIAGALSIGTITELEALRYQSCLPVHLETVKTTIRTPRYAGMHVNHRRDRKEEPTDGRCEMSGFLMRSDLVSNWKGIEVQGFLGEKQIDILRMERLSDKILICIFEAEIDTVKLFEPKEELHFGTRDHNWKINVRRIDEGHEGELLYDKDTNEPVVLSVPTEDNGRVKVTDLIHSISQRLNALENEMQSPQLALEMLSVAGQCVFRKEGV